jgi:hypothetical protein
MLGDAVCVCNYILYMVVAAAAAAAAVVVVAITLEYTNLRVEHSEHQNQHKTAARHHHTPYTIVM